jgi:hypothetical protein
MVHIKRHYRTDKISLIWCLYPLSTVIYNESERVTRFNNMPMDFDIFAICGTRII